MLKDLNKEQLEFGLTRDISDQTKSDIIKELERRRFKQINDKR
jgi:hypothetical protein